MQNGASWLGSACMPLGFACVQRSNVSCRCASIAHTISRTSDGLATWRDDLDCLVMQVFIMALLKRLKAEGHRTLVFSQSRVMLDTLQKACKRDKVRSVRIDGSIVSAAKRQAIVERFQQDKRIPVFLLSSQVRSRARNAFKTAQRHAAQLCSGRTPNKLPSECVLPRQGQSHRACIS